MVLPGPGGPFGPFDAGTSGGAGGTSRRSHEEQKTSKTPSSSNMGKASSNVGAGGGRGRFCMVELVRPSVAPVAPPLAPTATSMLRLSIARQRFYSSLPPSPLLATLQRISQDPALAEIASKIANDKETLAHLSVLASKLGGKDGFSLDRPPSKAALFGLALSSEARTALAGLQDSFTRLNIDVEVRAEIRHISPFA